MATPNLEMPALPVQMPAFQNGALQTGDQQEAGGQKPNKRPRGGGKPTGFINVSLPTLVRTHFCTDTPRLPTYVRTVLPT